MGLFSRRRRRSPGSEEAAPTGRAAQQATVAHFRDFIDTRVGVEAYVEPQTNVTQTTLMLIATTGDMVEAADEEVARRTASELASAVETSLG